MTMVRDSGDVEMLYMATLYMAKPGACSSAKEMPSDPKVPASPSPARCPHRWAGAGSHSLRQGKAGEQQGRQGPGNLDSEVEQTISKPPCQCVVMSRGCFKRNQL